MSFNWTYVMEKIARVDVDIGISCDWHHFSKYTKECCS